MSQHRQPQLSSLAWIAVIATLLGALTGCGFNPGNPAAAARFKISVEPQGGGKISVPGDGQFAKGTAVTLTPQADVNWEFVGWGGRDGGRVKDNKVVVDGELAITGIFRQSGVTSHTVSVSSIPTSGVAPRYVNFTAKASDPEGHTLTYHWNFGDGAESDAGQMVTHVYLRQGTYTATVTISDGQGGSASASSAITVTGLYVFETTQTDFQQGTLTHVTATPAGDLEVVPSREGFESASLECPFTGSWVRTSTTPHTGSYCFSSVPVATWSKVSTSLTATVPGGLVSFWYRIHSYSDLSFYVDGVRQLWAWGTYGWTPFTCYVNAGTHKFEWTYSQGYSRTGIDAAFIDDLTLPTAGSRVVEYALPPITNATVSEITWSATTPLDSSLAVETRLSLDGGATWPATWQTQTNGGAVPGITAGTNLSSAKLQLKETLTANDPNVRPKLHDLTLMVH